MIHSHLDMTKPKQQNQKASFDEWGLLRGVEVLKWVRGVSLEIKDLTILVFVDPHVP